MQSNQHAHAQEWHKFHTDESSHRSDTLFFALPREVVRAMENNNGGGSSPGSSPGGRRRASTSMWGGLLTKTLTSQTKRLGSTFQNTIRRVMTPTAGSDPTRASTLRFGRCLFGLLLRCSKVFRAGGGENTAFSDRKPREFVRSTPLAPAQ